MTSRELHYAVAERWRICCTIASWLCDSRRWWLRFMLHCRIVKIRKHVDVSFGVFECEVSPDSRHKRSDHSLGDGIFCFLILWRWKKWICFFLGWRWQSLLANTRPRSAYKYNIFNPPLFRIFAKALRIDLLVWFFSRSAYAKFENFSTTINTNVWPLLNIFGFCKSIKSARYWSSTPLTTVRWLWKLRRTRRCKGCLDAQSVDGECVLLYQSPNLWRCVQLFLKSRDRGRAEQLSCQHALLQIVWRQQLHRYAINESKLWNTPSTDFTVKLFVCVKLILLGHVSKSGTTLNVLHIWIGCILVLVWWTNVGIPVVGTQCWGLGCCPA